MHNLKYGGYYPPGAEEMAERRLRLRREGRYEEADALRKEAAVRFDVEIIDTKTGWGLQWMNRRCRRE